MSEGIWKFTGSNLNHLTSWLDISLCSKPYRVKNIHLLVQLLPEFTALAGGRQGKG